MALLTAAVTITLRTPVAFTTRTTGPTAATSDGTTFGGSSRGSTCTLNTSLNHCVRGSLGRRRGLNVGLSGSRLVTNIRSTFTSGDGLSSRRVRRALRTFRTHIGSSTRTGVRGSTTSGRTGNGRCHRGFTGRGNIGASSANLICRMIRTNGNRTPGSDSAIMIGCGNALVSNGRFSGSCAHNRPLSFHLSNIVPN